MKQWYLLVVLLYVGVVVALSLPVVLLAFYPVTETLSTSVGEVVKWLAHCWQYWVWVAVLVLAQILFLRVPVDITKFRPVSRRSLLRPVIAAGLMVAFLCAGVVFVVGETVTKDPLADSVWWIAWAVLVISWFLWSWCFWSWSKDRDPRAFLAKVSRSLFRGSILELLIAVPAHIFVRHRDYCCAGFGTFLGIAFGLAVMFFAFGPAVLFLYVARLKRLRPQIKRGRESIPPLC